MGEPLVCLHQEGAVDLLLSVYLLFFTACNCILNFLSSLSSSQIAGFVNAKPTDASIQQVSLDILESMVLSSHSLFLQVKQEVTMERLIAHLQV